MFGSNTNLVTTVIGFGMSATFIVFVCSRIICGRLRGSAESQNMFEFEPRMDIEQPEHHSNHPEPVLVTTIPTVKFNQEAFSSIEDIQCVICLAEYKEREVLRIMPKCGHSFHLSCIDMWLRKQSTCPVCRVPLQNSSETKHVRPVTFSMVHSESQTSETRDGERHIEPVPGSPQHGQFQTSETRDSGRHIEPVPRNLGHGQSQTSETRDIEMPIEPVPGNPEHSQSQTSETRDNERHIEAVPGNPVHGQSQTSEMRDSEGHVDPVLGNPIQSSSAEPETGQ